METCPVTERPQSAHVAPLLLLAMTMAVGFTAMGSFGMVQEGAKAELHLSDATLGIVQGLSAAVPLVLLSIPIGLLVDRVSRVRLTIVLASVWTLGTLLTAFASNAGLLFLARMLTGIGTTGALTAALSLCADYCAPAQRGRANTLINLGKSLGIAAAFGLTGWLFGLMLGKAGTAWFGTIPAWRSTHIVLAGISVLLTLPLFLLREPVRREREAAPNAPFKVMARELWTRRRFLGPLFAGQVAVVMADAAANIWVSPLLIRDFGLQPQNFGSWVGALVFGTGVVGAICGGAAADWGQKSDMRGGLLLGAVVAAGLGVPAALFPVMPTVFWLAVAFGALTLCGAVTGLIVAVALTVYIPNELRGLCIGAFIALAGLIGFGIAPTLVTLVSTMLGGEAHLGLALTIVGVTVSMVSFGCFALAMRHTPIR